MASASKPPLNSSAPKQLRPILGWRSVLALLPLAGLLAWATIRVLEAGFINAEALSRWAKVLGLAVSDAGRFENLGVMSPQVPVHLLMPFYYIPGLRQGAAPYLFSCLLGALLLALWYGQLARRAVPRWARCVAVLLVAAHPFFLWLATSGSKLIISLFLHFALATLLARIISGLEGRQHILFAFVLVMGFLTDERFLYVFLLLVPLMPFVMPRRMLLKSPVSFYVVACTPMLFSFLSWAYLNWVFYRDAWQFLVGQESEFGAALQQAPFTPWLGQYGGQFLAPLGVAAATLVLAFPAILLLAWRNRQDREFRKILLVCMAIGVGTTTLGTATRTLTHPLETSFVAISYTMALISLEAHRNTHSRNWALLATLALGLPGGWAVFTWIPTQEQSQWRSALFYRETPSARFTSELALGDWLRENRQPTMIDDRLAYPAVVARGNAEGLLLPYSEGFQQTIRNRRLSVPQVAVPDPRHGDGFKDSINNALPDLYPSGAPGYRLVYDHAHWRVYRQRKQP